MHDDSNEKRITEDVSALLNEAAKVRKRRGTPTPTRPLTQKEIKQAQKQRQADEAKAAKVAKAENKRRKQVSSQNSANASIAAESKAPAKPRKPRQPRKKVAPAPTPVVETSAVANKPAASEHGLPLVPVVSLVAALLSITLAVVGWQQAPKSTHISDIEQPSGVPAAVMRRWLVGFPAFATLRKEADQELFHAFVDYLRDQPSVSAVNSVGVAWLGTGDRRRRTLTWDITMRQPVLPVRLASGDLRWVDSEGVLLPGSLSGDAGLPEVKNYRASQRADGSSPALTVLLAIWPELRRELESIDDLRLESIDLHHRLDEHSDRRGIVFQTQHGTKLIWGGPEEDRYGVDWPRRIRQLSHAIRCQGDLSQVAVVNARFTDPFTVAK